MAMEYQVGSLADMISGSSPAPNSKKVTGTSGSKIKFKKVTQPKVQSTPNISKKKRKLEEADSQKKRLRFSEPIEMGTVSGSKNVDPNMEVGEDPPKFKKWKINVKEEWRTVFVGNLANTTEVSDLRPLFAPYGPIESIRFRSAAVANPQTSKKVAMIKREFHPSRSNINAYIRYKTVECARKALAANGMVMDGRTIRVDMAAGSSPDSKKCVFVGNLALEIEEENLRELFEDCGQIVNVRVVRDKKTGMGKGIAFIEFESSDSVELALKLATQVVLGRPVRVARVFGQAKGIKGMGKKPRNEKKFLKPHSTKSGVNGRINKGSEGGKNKKPFVPQHGAKQGKPVISGFQGEKTDNKKSNKKKKKQNKGELKKKIMQSKLGVAPKSKKMKPTKEK